MVQISPLLYVIPVVSHSSLSSSTPNGGELAVRQGIETGGYPPECQSSCQVMNALGDCTADSCDCTTSIGNQLEDCMNCLVSAVPSVEPDAESIIEYWNGVCGGNLKLSSSSGPSSVGSSASSSTASANPSSSTGTSPSSSGSSGTSGGAKSGGAVALGTGNIAACVVAVLGIAGAFLHF